jgi:hypothetical protein
MTALKSEDLLNLEKYNQQRENLRKEVIALKKNRLIQIGENISLLFENKKTIQYQVQEMLRIEKIFEAAGIEEELNTYNPLIPDGTNLKATNKSSNVCFNPLLSCPLSTTTEAL